MLDLQKQWHSSGDNMEIIVNRLNKSIVAYDETVNKNPKFTPRKKWYNTKSIRTKTKLKTIINFLFHERQNPIYFVTLTTKQFHSERNGKFPSDSHLFRAVGLWLKNRSADYVCTLERQRDTQDLHFHILIERCGGFDIQSELQHIARLFGVQQHSALFDVKRIQSERAIGRYLYKYISKTKVTHCELFTCRTFSISKRLSNRYKQNADRFVRKLSSKNVGESAINATMRLLGKPIHSSNFHQVYEYKPKLAELLIKRANRKLQQDYEGACELSEKTKTWIEENKDFLNQKTEKTT